MFSKHPPSLAAARIVGRTVLASFMAVFLAANGAAQSQQSVPDVTALSMEDLMNIQVTSVSKRTQKVADAAAAIFVITQEDLRRSGATSIPEALRLVPGLEVARIDENKWAIGSRGFNGRFDNKLLVLIDGRSVYTPLFSGVYWNVQDVMLEDIERIEVIRGPGATMWGANAVNAVINIITRKAAETRGGMVVAGGGGLGKSTDYRVYTKYFNQDHMPGLAGQDGGDGWHLLRGGFRSDSRLSPKDTLMVQGDLYTGKEGNPSTLLPAVTSPGVQERESTVPLSGGFLYSVWDHVFSTRSDTSLKISFDRYKRDDELMEQ